MDKIGEDFDLVVSEGACPFTFTLGEDTLTGETISDNKWGFKASAEDTDYAYEITYTPGDSEQFTVDIKVKIENAKPITISYDVRLTDDAVAAQKPGTTEPYETTSRRC